MQLGDLLDDLTLDIVTSSIEVERVEIHSQLCEARTLFFAMPGTHAHGVEFASDAVARGAVAIVASEPLACEVPVVMVPASQLRTLVAHASAAVVGHPEYEVDLVGVTGTNGKTSVTTLVAELARAIGWNAANIGTLTSERTTPASPELFRTLRHLVDGFDPSKPRSVIALEVSSHALDQARVEGLRFAVGAFTNLGHDHLDYHETMEKYFEAKARLFTSEYIQRGVVWCDDPYGRRLADSSKMALTCVSRSEATDVEGSLTGTRFFWRQHVVSTSLVGDYNVDNALMAMSALGALGAPSDMVAAAMSDVRGVPGRFEVVHSNDVVVIVDYAHTPEGLQRLLGDVRALAGAARIITVFGCGGDRDQAKRPQMGAVATSLSDLTIVTSDNPRSESPDAIIDAIMSGTAPDARVQRIVDRRAAIAEALGGAVRGDVVVIAGKGHETTQTIGDVVAAFDDRQVARELLR